MNEYLTSFVEEAITLNRIGLEYFGRNIQVAVQAIICYAPARAMISSTKSHSSHLHGCGRCTGSGTSVGGLK